MQYEVNQVHCYPCRHGLRKPLVKHQMCMYPLHHYTRPRIQPLLTAIITYPDDTKLSLAPPHIIHWPSFWHSPTHQFSAIILPTTLLFEDSSLKQKWEEQTIQSWAKKLHFTTLNTATSSSVTHCHQLQPTKTPVTTWTGTQHHIHLAKEDPPKTVCSRRNKMVALSFPRHNAYP